MKKVILILIFIVSFSSIAQVKNCKKGTLCGNSCISIDKVCKINNQNDDVSTNINFSPNDTQYSATNQNFDNAKSKLIKLYQENPKQTTFYCDCQFSFDNKKGIVNFNQCGYKVRKNQNRAERLEWEHVMPAENFGRHLSCWQNGGRKACKKDTLFNRMEGDLHNLQPSIGEVNGDRSNYRYSLFTENFDQYGQCKTAVDFKLRKFQPREEIRGIIARSYFYMSKTYNINLSKQDEQLMEAWNKMYPPAQWECQRNQLIKKIQGNDNQFITIRCPK